MEDARSLGKPIVLSDIPVHLEQRAPRSHLFSATSSVELRQKLLEVWRTYPSGPDQAMERQARAQTDINRCQMADDFLGLIKSVVG